MLVFLTGKFIPKLPSGSGPLWLWHFSYWSFIFPFLSSFYIKTHKHSFAYTWFHFLNVFILWGSGAHTCTAQVQDQKMTYWNWVWVPTFHLGPEHWTQVVRLDSKGLYHWSILPAPWFHSKKRSLCSFLTCIMDSTRGSTAELHPQPFLFKTKFCLVARFWVCDLPTLDRPSWVTWHDSTIFLKSSTALCGRSVLVLCLF